MEDLLTSGVLACPICRASFATAYECENGHRFPVVEGVPVLIPGLDEVAEEIGASFGREWDYFRHGVDRTWGHTTPQRKREFLQQTGLDAADLAGKRVLDAGCGNGMLSAAISEYGCDVYACDVSPSVHNAARYFADNPSVRFLRANLIQPPFAHETFDVVFCAGVLHHTPSTRYTFDRVAETVKPGGRLFVWLYHELPGTKQHGKAWLRSYVARLPEPVRHAVALAFTAKKRVTDREMSWEETLTRVHDYWTPRYRHVHTPAELADWFREAGFGDATVTETGVEGFGAVAVRQPVAQHVTLAPVSS